MSTVILERNTYWRTDNKTSTLLRPLRPTLRLGQWTLPGKFTTNPFHRTLLSKPLAHVEMMLYL